MATYNLKYEEIAGGVSNDYQAIIEVSEIDLYGSSRLGTTKKAEGATKTTTFEADLPDLLFENISNVIAPNYVAEHITSSKSDREVGRKTFELSNHLGNVLATVTDRRIQVPNGSNISYYVADVVSYSDYYPFGMVIEGRSGSSGEQYRYGFQNQEKDNEISGEGNSLNFEFRMHNPRIGRFFSVDPLAPLYAYNSPYAFSENRVIDAFELEGLECVIYTEGSTNQACSSSGDPGHTMISIMDEEEGLIVYSYGRYGENQNVILGDGYLINRITHINLKRI